MWSLETIIRINEEAGKRAQGMGLEPYLIEHDHQIADTMPPFPFPHLGDDCVEVDKLYERVDTLFCDSSGYGRPGEDALTTYELVEHLSELLKENPNGILTAIEEQGQFQLYVAVWKA